MPAERHSYLTVLALENMTSVPIKLIVEPWANEFMLDPQVTVRIVGISPHMDGLGVEYHPDAIIVTGYRESQMRLYSAGTLMWESWADVPPDPPMTGSDVE